MPGSLRSARSGRRQLVPYAAHMPAAIGPRRPGDGMRRPPVSPAGRARTGGTGWGVLERCPVAGDDHRVETAIMISTAAARHA